MEATTQNLIYKYSTENLLSTNKKLAADSSVKTHGLSLLPHNLGGGYNLCPHATKGCKATCLVYSGNARFTAVNIARNERTKLFLDNRQIFVELLKAELMKINVAGLGEFKQAVRLNVFSDIPFEKHIQMEDFNRIQFYDYTKNPKRMMKFLTGNMPKNYHLTFSLSSDNMEESKEILSNGGNVAMVFKLRKGQDFPNTYMGYKVINGDKSDYRPADGKGVIVGLKFKQAIANKSKTEEIFSIDLRKK